MISQEDELRQEAELLRKQLQLLKLEQKDRELNPHKYYDLYPWQDEFIYQREHIKKYGRFPTRLYLTACNQGGKTLTLQLFAHRLCTDVEFRQQRWGDNQPRVNWYVLPTQDHINDFYDEKWVPEILSTGEAKKTGPYAWKVIKKGKDIKGIHFLNTNCKLIFVTMKAQASSMQGRSVGAIIFDEEPDTSKLGELETRTNSFNDPETGLSSAIIAFAFTPTSAQDYFKKVFCYQDYEFLKRLPEDIKKKYFYDKQRDEYRTCTIQQEKQELFKVGPSVYKRRVSLFETQKFKSGKPGRYTEQRIREIIASQPSKKDLMVRVFASFEKEDNGGLVYKSFDRAQHIKIFPRYNMNMNTIDGIRTAGIDYGSGSNHPGGVVVTWISPDKKKARVIKMWRGEKGKVTTAKDIILKFIEMTKDMHIDFPFYDHSCADLKTIYNRITGKNLIPAVKDKEGYGIVDAMLSKDLLKIWDYHGENSGKYADWVATEFENIDFATPKKDRTDELTDCIRYSLAGVAHYFNLEDLDTSKIKDPEVPEIDIFKEKTPLDYGCRSWEQVEAMKKKNDEWNDGEEQFWEECFEL